MINAALYDQYLLGMKNMLGKWELQKLDAIVKEVLWSENK
jgi:hypothetical protein